MNKSIVASAILFKALLVLLPMRAQGQDFPKEEYEAKVRAYLKSLENLSVEFTTTDHTLDGSHTFYDEYSIISIPNYFRAKTITRQTGKDGKESLTTEWALARPDGYYVVSEKAGQFLLKWMVSDVTSPYQIAMRYASTPYGHLIKPVCRGWWPIPELLAGNITGYSVQPRDFRRLEQDGKTIYTFRTIDSRKIDSRKAENAETEYELNDRWLLNRCTIKMLGSKQGATTQISYTTLGDRQLPLRITVNPIGTNGQLISPGFVGEFRNYKVYNGSRSEFSLTQFGLPESFDFEPEKPSRRWLYVLVSALALLGLAFVFRWLYRRSMGSTVKKMA